MDRRRFYRVLSHRRCTYGVLIHNYLDHLLRNILIIILDVHMNMARYVLCCKKHDLQHKTLAMADCDYSRVVISKRTCGTETHFSY